jgi:phosphatidylglycerol lysyltransferase
MGLVNLLSATTPSLRERVVLLQQWLPLALRFGSHLAAALSGFALLLVARGLWRRKRAAWSLTLAILIVSAGSHLLKGLDYEEAVLAVGLALWLLHSRAAFSARSDPPSVRHAGGVFAAAVVFTLVYGVLGLNFLDRHFSIDFDWMQSVRQVTIMFTQFQAPDVVPITPFGRYFADSIYMVAAATIGYALLALVRPVLVRHPASAGERAHARRIVERYGKTSLAWFASAT